MKTNVILTLCIVFVWGLVASFAQVQAGSPEDKAFQKIDAENNPDAKVTLLLDFEKQFPQSKTALSLAYMQLIQIYQQKNDNSKIIEFGEKAINVKPDNIDALLAVTRAYSLDGKNASLDKAITYGQRCVEQLAKMKSMPPQQGKSDGEWKEYIASSDNLAQQYLSYAKALRGTK